MEAERHKTTSGKKNRQKRKYTIIEIVHGILLYTKRNTMSTESIGAQILFLCNILKKEGKEVGERASR